MSVFVVPLFLILYWWLCAFAEGFFDAMCIDFIDYVIENGDEKDQIKLSKLIGANL